MCYNLSSIDGERSFMKHPISAFMLLNCKYISISTNSKDEWIVWENRCKYKRVSSMNWAVHQMWSKMKSMYIEFCCLGSRAMYLPILDHVLRLQCWLLNICIFAGTIYSIFLYSFDPSLASDHPIFILQVNPFFYPKNLCLAKYVCS